MPLAAGTINLVSGTEGSPPGPAWSVAPEPKRSLGGRIVWALVGLVLLASGVGLLGWAGYEYFGTNIISERAFTKEKDELRARWEVEGTASERGTTPAKQAKKDRERQIPGNAIALLRVPAFGAEYEVPILAGTDMRDLNRGVGHYDSTAMPGQIGNFALAGHRVTHGQPFAELLELDRGDEVIVETRDAVYTYVIDDPASELTVPNTAGWVLEPVPGKPKAKPTKALITLTTCQDLFRSKDRSVGFGHLASTKTKS
jgi:sortase A